MNSSNNLSYPIGTYQAPENITEQHIKAWIQDIADLPNNINTLVKDLSEAQLNYRYRPGGWTIAQLVHHLCDSHLNAYTRFKLAITEDNPTIRPYQEALWANHIDATTAVLKDSSDLLSGLHGRWATFLKSLSPLDLKRTFYHPQRKQSLDLAFTIGDYSWHGRHHTAHIRQALELKY